MTLHLVRPQSVRDAAGRLAGNAGARFLGGGTILVRALTSTHLPVDELVLCDGLGLDRIDIAGRRASLGSAVTMARIAAHPALALLAPVAHSIGGPALRSMATVGGNLFARAPYGDLAVALLALGAAVTVEGAAGATTTDLDAFLADRAAYPGVVTGVVFDLPADGAFRFLKVIRRHPHSASVLSIAACLPDSAGRLVAPRVAYGAMAPTAIRAHAVEAALAGRRLDASAVEAAKAVAANDTAPADDPFASAWYRRTVLPVHLGRLLAA